MNVGQGVKCQEIWAVAFQTKRSVSVVIHRAFKHSKGSAVHLTSPNYNLLLLHLYLRLPLFNYDLDLSAWLLINHEPFGEHLFILFVNTDPCIQKCIQSDFDPGDIKPRVVLLMDIIKVKVKCPHDDVVKDKIS